MLARMLGVHSGIFTFRELHFFEELWRPGDEHEELEPSQAESIADRLLHNHRQWYLSPYRPGRYLDDARVAVAGAPAQPKAHEVFDAVLSQEAARNGKGVACEQTPRNVFYIPEILRLYPDAVVVAVVRDPRDVLLSQRNWWRRRFRGSNDTPWATTARRWADYHPVTMTLLWRGGVRAADRQRGDQRVLVVRFEDILDDPRRVLESILDRLGLSFEPAMVDVPRTSSSNAADRDEAGVDPSVAGRWRTELTRTEIWISQRLTRAERERHGYATDAVSPSASGLLWAFASLPLKSGLALAFNTGRNRDLVGSVRRRLAGGR